MFTKNEMILLFFRYEGTHCEINIDECVDSPCWNNGTCFDNYGSYVCNCPEGFGGQNCEFNLNECLSNPCLKGGICVDEFGSYYCKCPHGYTGKHCENSVRGQCENAACPSNSFCLDAPSGLQCVCKPGFMGNPPNCTINFCAGKPCSNGGTCNSDINGYNCTCPPAWKGILNSFIYIPTKNQFIMALEAEKFLQRNRSQNCYKTFFKSSSHS